MLRWIVFGLNFGGALLALAGVFVFANAIAGRSLSLGNFKIASGADAGMFLLVAGLMLFAASFVTGKLLKKKL